MCNNTYQVKNMFQFNKKLFYFLFIFLNILANSYAVDKAVYKESTNNNISGDLVFPSGRTLTINGSLTGTPSSGNLDLSSLTLTLPSIFAQISDVAFASSWNGVTTVAPTKNTVYDFLHLSDTDDDGKINVLDIAAGLPFTDVNGIISLITSSSTVGQILRVTGTNTYGFGALDLSDSDATTGSLFGSLVSFVDTDSNFIATNIQAAIEELDDINGIGPNAIDGKVSWTQLVNIPAGFADGSDDGSGGSSGTLNTIKENGIQLGGSDIVTLDFLGNDFDLTESPDTEINLVIASILTRDTEWDSVTEINSATTDDDFLTLLGTQIVSGIKTFSGISNRVSGTILFDSDALRIDDINASHQLIITPGSDLTADRILTVTTGDTARTLTLNGDTTLSGTNTGDQTITLTGDVTGSGAGSFATTITDNSVDGTDIALGSDAQGDIMYYDGTNWVRLTAGTIGQVLHTNGAAANPTWDTDDGAGGGAPTDATYITQIANGSLSAEQALGTLATGFLSSTTTTGVVASRTFVEGLAIDITNTNGIGNPSFAFDPVELSGSHTFGDASTDTIVWTFNRATGTDPAITFGNSIINISTGSLQEGGNDIYNSSETPGGELGGTWASPTIDDSVSVTNWTLTTPTISGTLTLNNNILYTDFAMGALSIDTSEMNNTKTISADSILTFSSTPATGAIFGLQITNSDTSAHTITIPSSKSEALGGAARTTFVLAPSQIATISWRYEGSSVYTIYGDPVRILDLTSATVATADSFEFYDVTDGLSKRSLISDLETPIESLVDLQDLQGAITDAQVPNTITIDLATTATTANTGDTATAFFSVGQIERARGGTGADTSAFGVGLLGSDASNNTIDVDTEGELETALGGIDLVNATRTLTIAGTSNEITSSSGAQDLTTNRTWTLSLPTALTFTGKTVTGGIFNAATLTGSGGGISIDASGFNGNLTTTDDTLQEIAQKLDDLSVGGATNWTDIADASGDTSIALAGFETDFTSTIDVTGESIWTITNTDVDAVNDNSFIDLRHNDGTDPNIFYARFIGDNDGSPITDYSFSQTAFSIGSGIITTFNGAINVPDNSFILGTKTTGNYVESVATTAPIMGGAAGSEGSALTISLDQTANYDWTGIHTFDADAVQIDDTDASHQLVLTPGSNLTADRVFTIITGDAARTLTLNGDTTLSGTNTGDQTITLTGDVTGSGTGSFATTITNNSVALTTDTIGNYVADITGTSNEINVSHTPAEGSTATISLPAMIDLGGKTSFEIPNGATPTVDAFGELAGDNDFWAASRGAPVFFDGTTSTVLVNVLVSDAPSNGQVPKWNTGGTITWEDDSTAAGGSIENEAFGSAWNGDITNGAAKDNLHDWGAIFDPDYDGKVSVLDLATTGFPAVDSSGALVASRTISEGLSIDVTNGDGSAGNPTITFDSTELNGSRTFGDASTDTIVWTINRATGTDPTITFDSGSIALQALTLTTPLTAGSGGTGLSSLGTGIATWLGTPSSANLRSALTDEVGTGAAMFTRTGVRRTVYINAGAMIARTTNGAATATVELATNDIMVDSFDFDSTTSEGIGFWWTPPPVYDGGTLTAKFHWTAATGTGTATWSISARALGDDDAIDQALGTAQTVTDTLITANDMHVSAVTAALTAAGTPAGNKPMYFQITRDVADTLNADARLIGCTIEYTESSTEPSTQ